MCVPMSVRACVCMCVILCVSPSQRSSRSRVQEERRTGCQLCRNRYKSLLHSANAFLHELSLSSDPHPHKFIRLLDGQHLQDTLQQYNNTSSVLISQNIIIIMYYILGQEEFYLQLRLVSSSGLVKIFTIPPESPLLYNLYLYHHFHPRINSVSSYIINCFSLFTMATARDQNTIWPVSRIRSLKKY